MKISSITYTVSLSEAIFDEVYKIDKNVYFNLLDEIEKVQKVINFLSTTTLSF